MLMHLFSHVLIHWSGCNAWGNDLSMIHGTGDDPNADGKIWERAGPNHFTQELVHVLYFLMKRYR